LSKIEEFDPELRRLEEEIVQFLLNSYFYTGQKSSFTTIKSYFITRRDLTQDMLIKLTGLSRGTISQELKGLLDMGVIERSKVSNTGEITYTLKSVEFAFIHHFVNTYKTILEFDKELAKLKNDMDLNKNELENTNGFKDIYQIVSIFGKAMPFTLKLMEILEKELAILEKK